MRNILAIAHKELKSYFASPIAYVVIGLFALLYGYFYAVMLQYFVRAGMNVNPMMGQQALNINQDMLKRPVNVGFSGGEKKRNEILQMSLLEPKMCVLDETDSGLDIDALKIVADGVNRLRAKNRGFLVITHYQRLLDHIVPDVVHVMAKGRIVRTGGPELAHELEAKGYAAYENAA